ncbi:hypothetical protein ASF27_20990 [Methylobacterium sp. Leaf102]|uniref:recombinase family protein n=1 Tax=Methylobacterium sp. Leaf102 TaxID=1736253 RepID=UPI0007007944|nr:recombinase family protein [Methylobacterium sp. Leaf102]KQP27459.1 hypothetical protein ASF27_20990 [Methylobacterium sp. Leaf102]
MFRKIKSRALVRQASTARPRFAIYARCTSRGASTDSIDRQVDAAVDHVAEVGGVHVATFADRTGGGTSTDHRHELRRMLEAAEARSFGIVVVENLDRVSRDPDTLVTVFDRLHVLGIEIHLPGRGKLCRTDVTLQGMMVPGAGTTVPRRRSRR